MTEKALAIKQDDVTVVKSEPVDYGNLLNIAISKENGLEMVERIMDLQDRELKRLSILAYNDAAARFKAAPIEVKKDKFNKHTGSWYSSVGNLVNTVEPINSKCGLSCDWDIDDSDPAMIKVTCIKSHVGGHTKSVSMSGPPDTSGAKGTANKTEIQGRVSTVSYLMRTTYAAVNGIAAVEDVENDGNAAGEPAPEPIDEKDAVHILEMAESAPGGRKRFDPWLESAYGVRSAHDLTAKQGEAVKNSLETAIKSAKK